MSAEPLEVRIESRSTVCIISVAGPVDHVQYYKLEEAVQTQLDRRELRLVVDLSALTYIVSAGINTLGHAAAQYERVNGRLCFVRPAKYAQWQFFTTIGVDRILPWAASLEEAVQRVSDGASR